MRVNGYSRRNLPSRRGFLKIMGMGAAALAVPQGSKLLGAAAGGRPNVVLVITDDQGYGDLGCHGNDIIQTPFLDRFHKESVRLTDFHVSPTCAPTRSALLTGHFTDSTGCWHTIMGRSLLRADEVTVADVFKAGGYRTAMFGKWHLGDNYPFRPQDRGFDHVLAHKGGGVGQGPDYWGNDYFDDTYFRLSKPEKFEGYCTDIWFDGAMRFIEENKNRPFFCYLSTNAPHGPFNVAEKYSKLYEGNPKVPNANFWGMITNIDENMGRLRKKLKFLGLEDNTILIFMTDNGTAAGHSIKGDTEKGFNAGMRGKKGSEYEGGHRVPFFIRWPKGEIGGGVDVERLTAHVDVMPTLIALCGLKRPKGVKFDGRSIARLLKDPKARWRDRVLVTDSQRMEHLEKWRKCATMTQRWRLINGKELYDIQADCGQKTDVAAKHPEVVEKLRAEYEKWWTHVSERADEYCEIVLGSDEENPTCLMCHDWHTNNGPVPWNQTAVRSGQKSNGFFAVEVARAGSYEISLRRWPKEADKAINETMDRDKSIGAVKARLTIADVDLTQDVPKNAKAVTFKTQLKPGKTQLQTWFIDAKGDSRGAYYVYVERV